MNSETHLASVCWQSTRIPTLVFILSIKNKIVFQINGVVVVYPLYPIRSSRIAFIIELQCSSEVEARVTQPNESVNMFTLKRSLYLALLAPETAFLFVEMCILCS